MKYFVNLKDIDSNDVETVGGKNASIGEMIQNLSDKHINIQGGFASTANAYKIFISDNKLDKKISNSLKGLKINKISVLNKTSADMRRWIMSAKFSVDFQNEVKIVLKKFSNRSVAIRSSATAEDLPEASFAGQQETFLNVKGFENVLKAIKRVYASLFTSRAIAYRYHHGFLHKKFAISVGIQPMIRSDKGVSGVMFTLDTESGFNKVILINASYGLGEAIVQGCVNPDQYYVYKPALENNHFSIIEKKLGEKAVKIVFDKTTGFQKSTKKILVSPVDQKRYCLSDADIERIANYGLTIEKHYKTPMDIEWAKDGIDGEIYILQARPETVKVNSGNKIIEQYCLKKRGKILAQGFSVGQRIGSGNAKIITNPKNITEIKLGDVLVTDITDPDWEPIMKIASAIVTNRGGRTCHAAIIARELGIPAVVGCKNATITIKNNSPVTISCAEGETGYIYAEKLPYHVQKISVEEMPKIPLKLCMNVGNPDKAFSVSQLPNDGVGLARLEFIISGIGIHPNAALNFKELPKKIQSELKLKTAAFRNPVEYYVEKLSEGIAKISAAFFPKEVIFRFSDFKTNEYANLLGGHLFEPTEENPMLGFRGASRYYSDLFQRCFELECRAFIRVREKIGLKNAQLMIPFVRTVDELKKVISLMNKYGLKRGENNLKVYMMCEVPSNVILAESFLNYVDGFSIGSNDLTQLTLGIDRDSSTIASIFNERDEAVKALLHQVIDVCNAKNKYVGICGQGPSDHPDFAQWLMREGIQSMSLNPDTIISTWLMLAKNK